MQAVSLVWSPFQSFAEAVAICLAPKYNQTKRNRFLKETGCTSGVFVVALAPISDHKFTVYPDNCELPLNSLSFPVSFAPLKIDEIFAGRQFYAGTFLRVPHVLHFFSFFLPVLRAGRIDFGFIGTIASSRQSLLTASPQRPIQFSVSGLIISIIFLLSFSDIRVLINYINFIFNRSFYSCRVVKIGVNVKTIHWDRKKWPL